MNSNLSYATLDQFAQYGMPVSATAAKYSPDQIMGYLVGASRTAEGFMPSRVQPPLTSWELDLSRVVCQIAAQDMLGNRGGSPADSMGMLITAAAARAYEWLDNVSVGRVSLNVVGTSPTPQATASIVSRPLRGF